MRQVRWYNRDVFSIFFNMKVYCVFSLESPQRGDSNEYTHYTISQYKKETHPKLSQICNYGISSKGPKNEFEPVVVNEPSVFESLKFYCIYSLLYMLIIVSLQAKVTISQCLKKKLKVMKKWSVLFV